MVKDFIYSYFHPNIFLSFLVLYAVIFVFSGIVYKLGFARKLPILKSFIVYVVLAFGCLFLALMGTDLPIAESLIIAVVVLVIVKIRTRNTPSLRSKPGEEQEGRRDL